MPWHNAKPRGRSPTAPAAFIDPAIPTKASEPPEGNTWAHEIKHDGYRIQIHVTDNGVRLYTMSGYDWTDRYPLIVKAAGKIKGTAIIDADAAIVGTDGISDFEALHTRSRNAEAVAFAFDLMTLDGKDVRPAPWMIRRRMLKKLLGRRALGLSYSKEIVGRGPEVYWAACRMGLEGIVSKRIEAPYKSGKVKTWLKIKTQQPHCALKTNPEATA
jgi:bifunctional non-homologous end joining protein LigD